MHHYCEHISVMARVGEWKWSLPHHWLLCLNDVRGEEERLLMNKGFLLRHVVNAPCTSVMCVNGGVQACGDWF